MKRANLGRGLVILIIAGFFVYRYLDFASPIYLVLIVIFGGLGLLSVINYLSTRWQNIGLNLGISLLFLDLVFAGIKWAEFGRALAEANYWMLVPSTIFVLIHLYFRTLRAQWLLKPMGEVPFWPTFRALVIGITGNTVLPARAGEFLRAYVLGRSAGISIPGVFATVVVERIFDGLTVLLVLLGVIIWGVRNERLQNFGIIGAVFYVGAMVALIVFMTKRHWANTLINRFLPKKLAQLALGILDGFISGLAVLKNPRQLGMVLFWNIWTWVAIPISFWFALLAFNFGTPIPWTASVLMLPAMALALSIPSTPGGVGPVQVSIKLTLATFIALTPGVDETVAAASIIIHISQLGPEVILGVISFMIEGLSTGDIQAGREMVDTTHPQTTPGSSD